MSDVMVRLPKAQARVLGTAKRVGYVMIDGAFSGDATAHQVLDGNGRAVGDPGFNPDTAQKVYDEGFDGRGMIERCYALGYLRLGSHFNHYVLTDLGARMVS